MNNEVTERTEYRVLVEANNHNFEWVTLRVFAGTHEYAQKIANSFNTSPGSHYRNARIETRKVSVVADEWVAL